MLHLFRRHRKTCKQTQQNYRRCACPIYVKGTLDGVYIRESLDQTDWTAATTKIAQWTKDGVIRRTDASRSVHVGVQAFLSDATSRGLALATLAKYKLLLGRLETFCSDRHGQTAQLNDLTLDTMTQFRSSWPGGLLAKSKTQERLGAFFHWCVARGWVLKDPTDGLSALRPPHVPTLPFTAEELTRIVAACDHYPTYNSFGYDNRARMHAMVQVLRWSGLRIHDASTLEWQRLQNGKLFLRTQKTGTHVNIPLPPVALTAINALERRGSHIFWTGRGKPESTVSNWQRALRNLFELAEVPNGHAHRFRDTFAVELLLQGVELADVSMLLGHSSIKVTERHYAPWVQARQNRLESIVTKAWKAGQEPHA